MTALPTAGPMGMLGALMGGGPLPLPKIPCGICIGQNGDVAGAAQAVTLLGGTLVCADHAQDVYAAQDNAAALVRMELDDYRAHPLDTPANA